MSSVLSSQGLVLATAMAISSTLVFLAFSRKQTLPEPQNTTKQSPTLRSCLSSGDKKRDRKKKKVRFAENVEEEKMVERVTESSSKRVERSCRNQIPENQAALYSGILRDRVQRMACSY
ncbi:PREDICTED: uncharacterized protein LOC101299686 [Fragaria vesca subsp. vesca]|uniref:uncharacterized protein LOC101299686 n=1 Tax=Fragaria vesca subsp. vesca TaxID=101020 RepID=UPI0002C32A45|nr:PREDICTED: uncharacterized protein LOC101299686 [Fragaria vesca subsp. vesca]